ncbi:MAG: hypothetical protein KKB34_05445 [Bacteroidetes bacterium]|nr:hypothetical protein [Bacteroidota bacterium]
MVWRKNITIMSVQFQNVYLRIDGSGASQSGGKPFGKVNCQWGAGTYEHFDLINNDDEANTWSLRSREFENVYLRIDNEGQTSRNPQGFGKVNCRYVKSPKDLSDNEKFQLIAGRPDNVYAIRSVASDVYLRLDSQGQDQPNAYGFGVVNCQGAITPYERFVVSE